MKRLAIASVVLSGAAVLGLALAWLPANSVYRQRMAEAEAAWADIASHARPVTETYEPHLVATLPEIARRYFNHAISPGTPLASVVELEMEGSVRVLLAGSSRRHDMSARQILMPPAEFVWIARLSSGPSLLSATDGLHDSASWRRLWMFWAIPILQSASAGGPDRSAAMRPAFEAVWLPASLLPSNGASWEQVGPDTARVSLGGTTPIEVTLTISSDGRLTGVSAMRWSDDNPEKVFRLQPYAGTVDGEATFGGYTIPSLVHFGSLDGTGDSLDNFDAQIIGATYY